MRLKTCCSVVFVGFIALLAWQKNAQADCPVPWECICAGVDVAAVLEGDIVSTHRTPGDGHAGMLEVTAIEPADAAVPISIGDEVEVTMFGRSDFEQGDRVLAAFFMKDIELAEGELAYYAQALNPFGKDGLITCPRIKEVQFSRSEAIELLLKPSDECIDETSEQGLWDSWSCDDQIEVGCSVSRLGQSSSLGASRLAAVFLLLVSIGLLGRRRAAERTRLNR